MSAAFSAIQRRPFPVFRKNPAALDIQRCQTASVFNRNSRIICDSVFVVSGDCRNDFSITISTSIKYSLWLAKFFFVGDRVLIIEGISSTFLCLQGAGDFFNCFQVSAIDSIGYCVTVDRVHGKAAVFSYACAILVCFPVNCISADAECWLSNQLEKSLILPG